MSTPIKREDIRKGDRIRVIEERTATFDYTTVDILGLAYELVERPVLLPVEPGWYVARPDSKNSAHLQLCADPTCKDSGGEPHWFRPDQDRVLDRAEVAEHYMPLVPFAAVTTTAAQVLRELRSMYSTDDPTYWEKLDALAARWAAK